MLRVFYCSVVLLLLAAGVAAQGLYMPRNIQQAYQKGTRSMNGAPGPQYWQNSGRYQIDITANPPDRTIRGTETISYSNNSPDTLKSIVIRMICNLHKYQAPRSGYASSDFLTPGVTIDSLVINGRPHAFNNDVGTVAPVRLPSALLPKDSLQLRIAWHYEVSVQSGREGMIDSTTFFLAYFYPRVSVYDDYNGWDRIEHTDRAEFYSDFNDYTVAVKVPANYVVWATGNLMNAEEVLQPGVAQRLEKSYTSDEIMHIATRDDMQQHRVTRQNDWNTWRWTASHIADMTVGLSDHYVWDASSVVVDSSSGRRSSVQAAYNDTATDFHHSVAFGRYALNWFSHHWPGVPYPFPKMTAFQGYADMEYPMMVNDQTVGNDLGFAQLVQDHEIAHTYFPFYMGINETRYAFMDEGWATTFEYLIALAEKGKQQADAFYKQFRVDRYIHDPSAEEDQPIISMSTQVSGMGYGSNAYGKASLAYLALKDLLGDALFKRCLHTYMSRWNGKHPIPWDFFYSFSDASGQNLDWFWNNWFFSYNYIDLSVGQVTQKGSTATVNIVNKGGFAIPFDVVARFEDGTTSTHHQTPALWKNNQKEATVRFPAAKKLVSVQLEGGLFMDATEANNNWNAK
jgi:hypothetical protein